MNNNYQFIKTVGSKVYYNNNFFARTFSSSTIYYFPTGNDLSGSDKEYIKKSINAFYEEKVPRFTAQDKNKYPQFKEISSNLELEEVKHSTWIDYQSKKSNMEASKLKQECFETVSEVMKTKNNRVSSDKIKAEVSKECDAKFNVYGEYSGGEPHLPGHESWKKNAIDEGVEDTTEAEYLNRRLDTSDSNDKGKGSGNTPGASGGGFSGGTSVGGSGGDVESPRSNSRSMSTID